MVGPAKKRIAVIGIVLAILVTIGLVVGASWLSRDRRQLSTALNDVVVPQAFRQVESEKIGNRFCLDACPAARKHYLGNSDPTATRVTVQRAAEQAGFYLTKEDCQLPEHGCLLEMAREQVTVSILVLPPGDVLQRQDAGIVAKVETGEVGLLLTARRRQDKR